MVFPTFFNLSLNLTIRSSWSEPQSVPGLVFARINCIYLINLVIKFNNLENSHCFLFRGQVQMTFYFNGFCLHPNLFEEKNKSDLR